MTGMKLRLTFLLLAWVAAWAILMIIFLAAGEPLARLPLALRVLLISGVLVVSMTQLVIPFIQRILRRPGGSQTRNEGPGTIPDPS